MSEASKTPAGSVPEVVRYGPYVDENTMGGPWGAIYELMRDHA